MRGAWIAAIVVVLALTASEARAGTLTVENKTSSYITVSVDGNYGCNTAGNTTCTIPVSEAAHDLRAVHSDSGKVATSSMTAGTNKTWTLNESDFQ